MKKRLRKKKMQKCFNMNSRCGCCGGGIYGLGFLGSVIYYISTAQGFWVGVLGILKSIVWPAFLVFEIMKYLGM
ncbi:MAG: hypothetical protein PVJ67_01945 [Candidatus Pacearchaeota archaeon]|jgi:hypothetical protein